MPLPQSPAHLDPEQVKRVFFYVQIAFAVLVAGSIYLLTRERRSSDFKSREADRKSMGARAQEKPKDTLADAKMKRNEPLSLSGIRIDGEPHEILGIPRDAKTERIQSAYRDLMKRYHPDIVGRPGTREWSDAQKIAEALNAARTRMLAQAQSQSPNRSGR